MRKLTAYTTSLTICAMSWLSTPAFAGSDTAKDALKESQLEVRPLKNVVQNRFFLKTGRLELAPVVGYVPNNPMVKRYTGGLLGAYHFSENFAAEGAFIYSPDLGKSDLKGLTNTLVQIAYEGSADLSFQQPLDKMILGATFAARWAPIYGKINLIGENVLNFDFYGIAGLGMLSSTLYYAKYDEDAAAAGEPVPVRLEEEGSKIRVPVNLGGGINFFLNQTIALKLDARSYFYRAKKPQYDPQEPENEYQLYNTFIASAGISIFVPKMKPRMMDF